MTPANVRSSPARDERLLAVCAALVTVGVWASAFIGIRSAGRELAPGALALARLLVGSIALGAFVLARRERLPRGRALAGTVVCGALWFGLYNVALNAAERRVDAGIAAMLVNVGPILIAILAGLVLQEGFPPRLLVGCIVSFAGVAVIGIAISRHGIGQTWGAVLCVVAALAYAGGVVAQKPVLRRHSGLAVTWLACTIGAVACLPYAPTLAHQLGRASGAAIAWTIYLGMVPTAIGFALWAYALARTSAGRMGSTTYLVPPLAVLMGWAILGEVPPLLALPGGVLCLAGVALSRLPRRRARKPSPAEVALDTAAGG
ncbi:MAG: DMT family transporter [Solirubrobacterales bacterium]|nr:DMT family transporter [Solirubrobacterales bacterium]